MTSSVLVVSRNIHTPSKAKHTVGVCTALIPVRCYIMCYVSAYTMYAIEPAVCTFTMLCDCSTHSHKLHGRIVIFWMVILIKTSELLVSELCESLFPQIAVGCSPVSSTTGHMLCKQWFYCQVPHDRFRSIHIKTVIGVKLK